LHHQITTNAIHQCRPDRTHQADDDEEDGTKYRSSDSKITHQGGSAFETLYFRKGPSK
jgi:hypothetical protein